MNRRQFLAGLGAAAAIAPVAGLLPAEAAPVLAVDVAGGPDATVVYWWKRGVVGNFVFFETSSGRSMPDFIVESLNSRGWSAIQTNKPMGSELLEKTINIISRERGDRRHLLSQGSLHKMENPWELGPADWIADT